RAQAGEAEMAPARQSLRATATRAGPPREQCTRYATLCGEASRARPGHAAAGRDMPMALPNITEATIRQYAAPESLQRGREYQRQGAVLSLVRRGDALEAEVEGSEPAPYQVCVAFDAGGVAGADC